MSTEGLMEEFFSVNLEWWMRNLKENQMHMQVLGYSANQVYDDSNVT